MFSYILNSQNLQNMVLLNDKKLQTPSHSLPYLAETRWRETFLSNLQHTHCDRDIESEMLVEQLADCRNRYHSTDCVNQQNICLLVIIKISSMFFWNEVIMIFLFQSYFLVSSSFLNVFKNLHVIKKWHDNVLSVFSNFSEVFIPNTK